MGWYYNGKPWHSGFGQPLFVLDLSLGLGCPGTGTSDSSLRKYPGVSVKGGWRIKSAIWGVAKDQDSVRGSFSDYLASINSHRRKPFDIYNLHGTGSPEERKMLTWIPRAAKSAKEAGFQIHSFAIDDRWQDGSPVWQAAAVQFPRGLEPVTQAAQFAGAHLGLWLSLHVFTLTRAGGQGEVWKPSRSATAARAAGTALRGLVTGPNSNERWASTSDATA